MNRLALAALAVSLTGTGCIVHSNDTHDGGTCDPSVVVLDWSGGFVDADGNVLSCSSAAVQSIDVYVNGTFDGNFACTSGSVSAGALPSGSNLITVEGISGGAIAFRAEAYVDGGSCNGTDRVPLTPSEGWLDLAYSFSPVNVCAPSSTLWFNVWDQIAGAWVPGTSGLSCGASASYRLPAGSYQLDSTYEMIPAVGGDVVSARDCTQQTFNISGGAATPLSVILVDSGSVCP